MARREMPLLIDGHNLIGRMSDLSLEDLDDESDLARRVRRYCLRHNRRATIVFDAGLVGGRSHDLSTARVEVVFASAGRTADGIIRERVQRARDPRSLLVVTSDRAVQEAASKRGARVVPAEEFAAQLSTELSDKGAEQDKPTPPGSIEEWLDLFEEEGGDNNPSSKHSSR
jgi:predicted RNA-binding protein with PIN domain